MINRRLYAIALCCAATSVHAQDAAPTPCRVPGMKTEVLCGTVKRPLGDSTLDIHYVVVPALARNKKNDAVFFFAGGPGQSAIKLAPTTWPLFQRLNNGRDIVFIDQRGTGKSGPLECQFDVNSTLGDSTDLTRYPTFLNTCRTDLQRLPHGKLDQYVTTYAMQDADAVRSALGYEKINVIGGSYGTRAVLEYMRLFPQRVRRSIIDGVAPPDGILPTSSSPDQQAALDALLAGCETDAICKTAYPNLRRDWRALMDAPEREVKAIHPGTGREETIKINRTSVGMLVRGPLYAPALAAALPHAITQAAAGRFTPLFGLATLFGGTSRNFAWGMHFSVVCSEDFPLLAQSKDAPSADFGEGFATMYRAACNDWPKAKIDPGFYTVPTATFPVLVLSGGADPVTPPRHGERVAKSLGPNAQHIIVAQAGHGIMTMGCMRDAIYKFIDAKGDADAQKTDASCANNIPRPTAWKAPIVEAAK